MGGTSRNSLEADINASTQDKGFRTDMPMPLSLWKQTAGLVLTAATTPGIVAMGGSASPAPMVIKFAGASAATVIATFDGVVPGEFAFPPRAPGASFLSVFNYDLQLLVPIRKVEATDIAGDASLAFDVVFQFGSPGSQGYTLTAISKTLAAWVSDNTTDATGAIGFSTLAFDIGAEIRAEIAAGTALGSTPVLDGGDWFRIKLGPHATTDSGDYQEMLSPILRWRRHAALRYTTPATFKSIRGG